MYKVCLNKNECLYYEYIEDEPDYTDVDILSCPNCFYHCLIYTDEYFLNLRTQSTVTIGPYGPYVIGSVDDNGEEI